MVKSIPLLLRLDHSDTCRTACAPEVAAICRACQLVPAGALVTSVNTALAQVQSVSREPDHSIRFLFRSALLRHSAAFICIACSGVISAVLGYSCCCNRPPPNEARVGS